MTSEVFDIRLREPGFFAGDPDPLLADLRRRCPMSWPRSGNRRSGLEDGGELGSIAP
ncbi:MAG TPA: hypothetical protein VG032_04145 [Acidimicrobiales bacterium]|jgi:hypothetical protein|nr:hypothetical protein [Acidimicrobiales bacterium]